MKFLYSLVMAGITVTVIYEGTFFDGRVIRIVDTDENNVCYMSKRGESISLQCMPLDQDAPARKKIHKNE